jgi:hypothetical protein
VQFPEVANGFNRYTYVLNNPLIYTDPSGYNTKLYIDAIVSYLQSKGLNSWSVSGGFQNGAPTLSNGYNDASGGGASWGGDSGGGYSYTSYSGGWYWVIGVSKGKEKKFWRYNKNRRHSTGTNWVASWSTPNFDQSGIWGSSSSSAGFGGREYSSPGGSRGGATKAGEPNIYRLPVHARIAITLSGKAPIHFPDAVGWTPLNLDLVGVAGTEISVSSKINIINGPDKGQSIKVNLDIATAVGWDQGISGIRTEYYFFWKLR